MKDICYIVGAGECEEIYINEENKAYVIAVDGGMSYLSKVGILADFVIGDFDSLGVVPEHSNIVVLPTEKDDTDMYAAVNEAMKRGYNKFVIYGAMGGRIDHTIANCQLLNYIAEKGCVGFLVGKTETVTSIHNGKIKFGDKFKGLISVFSSGTTSKGVSIEGFKYELIDGELKNTYPIGTSNEFVNKEGTITVKEGTLLVTFECTPSMVCDGIGTNIIHHI